MPTCKSRGAQDREPPGSLGLTKMGHFGNQMQIISLLFTRVFLTPLQPSHW